MTKIWDAPVRLFHWALAATVVTSWVTAESGWMEVHLVSGYVALTLILFRLGWGLVGSDTARFTRFPLGPSQVLNHARTLLKREPAPWVGHNPLGSLMIVFMLGFFLLQACLGLMSTDDILVEGPLASVVPYGWSEAASDIHHEMGEFVPVIVGLHVAAAFFYWIWKRQNLIWPMITGRASLPEGQSPRLGSPLVALTLAVTAALAVFALVQWGRGA